MNERMFMRRIETLPEWQRATIEKMARQLYAIGGYVGSETDAVTDALYIAEAAFGGYLDDNGEPKE